MKENEVLTCDDFNFSFFPIFERDMADLADVVEVYRNNQMISIKTAQKLVGLNPDIEEDNISDEPEPVVVPTMDPRQEAGHLAKTVRKKRKKERRKAEN